VTVNGLISSFAHARGRASNDRQFFYINGRPCILQKASLEVLFCISTLTLRYLKIQTAINEVYKSFNATQFPFVVANLKLPLGQSLYAIRSSLLGPICACSDAYDVNVSPDKRSIFLHNELNLTLALKVSIP
jgi:DNA mismatch repair protein PMS2